MRWRSAGAAAWLVVALVVAGCQGPTPPEPGSALLDGAFEYEGSYGESASIDYVDETGEPVSVIGFPGFVTVFVEPGTPDGDVAAVAEANGAAIVAQLPSIGLYELKGEAGTEAGLVAAFLARPFTVDAHPSVAVAAKKGSAAEDAMVALYRVDRDVLLLDFYEDPLETCPWTTHGGHAETIVETPLDGESPDAPAVTAQGFEVAGSAAGGVQQIMRAARAAEKDGVVRVVSLSLGAATPDGVKFYPGCTEPHCIKMLHAQSEFLEDVYRAIQYLPESTRKHVAITVAAGNEALDLTQEREFLRKVFPDADKNILVVGGTQADGTPDPGLNRASGGGKDMVFAQGDKVTRRTPSQFVLPGTVPSGDCSAGGTSFSTPQLARLVAQVVKRVPGLSGPDAIQAIRDSCGMTKPAGPPAAGETDLLPGGWCMLPSLEEAVEAALALAGPTLSSVSISSGPVSSSQAPRPRASASVDAGACPVVSHEVDGPASYNYNEWTWRVTASGTASGPEGTEVSIGGGGLGAVDQDGRRLGGPQFKGSTQYITVTSTWTAEPPPEHNTIWIDRTRGPGEPEEGHWSIEFLVTLTYQNGYKASYERDWPFEITAVAYGQDYNTVADPEDAFTFTCSSL